MTTASTVAAGMANGPTATLLDLFPAGVFAAERREAGDADTLTPLERQCVAKAVPKRVREFAAGRACARAALAQMGITGVELPAGADRQPQWPAGVVGSITHTRGYCAAVVASHSRFAGLGVDTEQAEAVHEALWPQICTTAEIAHLHELPPERRVQAATLIFSAKEAFYKAQYPVTSEWVHFRAVEVLGDDWLLPAGAFRIRPRRRLALDSHDFAAMQGRFRFHEQFVTAGMALTRILVAKR